MTEFEAILEDVLFALECANEHHKNVSEDLRHLKAEESAAMWRAFTLERRARKMGATDEQINEATPKP